MNDLDTFLTRYTADDNVWWTISCGDHQSLFDQALERIDSLRADETVERMKAIADDYPQSVDDLIRYHDSMAVVAMDSNQRVMAISLASARHLEAQKAEIAQLRAALNCPGCRAAGGRLCTRIDTGGECLRKPYSEEGET